MTQHDPLIRITDMIDHATEAVALLGDQSDAQVADNRVLQLALIRLVEVVGEAASRVPDDVRQLEAQALRYLNDRLEEDNPLFQL